MIGLRLPELIIILLVMLVVVGVICFATFTGASKGNGQPPMNPYQQVPPTQGGQAGYQPQATSSYAAQQPAAPTRFCEQCGGPLKPGDAFCSNCGAPVKR